MATKITDRQKAAASLTEKVCAAIREFEEETGDMCVMDVSVFRVDRVYSSKFQSVAFNITLRPTGNFT